MTKADYRADIDGLRAIAVISVLLFHLSVPGLFGGYIGVDIFFVISGFLITGIILKNRERGQFTFSGFYLGRVRRIMPPLVATVAVTFLASCFILQPDDMTRLARSAVGALTSTSNILFYLEAGYWDTSSELKPLLHTWSLGVEEQFYLVWPALVVGVVRIFGSKHFTAILGLVTLASFVAMLAWHAVDPSAAFYMFPARIFQFAAGAWLGCAARGWTLAPNRVPGWVRDLIFLIGMAAVIAVVVGYDEHTPFPGWTAAPPTLAALLLLLSGSFPGGQGVLGKWVLCNPVSIWFGKVSYALYLVHWPIVALYRYETGLSLTLIEQIGLAVAMLVAGAVLHYGLERRFYVRSSGQADQKRLTPGDFALRTGVASLLVAGVAASAWWSQGWSWRFSNLHFTPEQIEAGMGRRFSRLAEGCRIDRFFAGDEGCQRVGSTRVLVLGNSHEPDGLNFVLGGYGHDPDLEVVYFGTVNQCQDLEQGGDGSWQTSREECQNRLDVFNRADFAQALNYVVYAANQPFGGNKQSLLEMIRSLKAVNPDLQVVTLGGYINTEASCARIANETGSTRACGEPDQVAYFADAPEQAPLYDAFQGLTDVFIDRVDLLCRDRALETCLTQTPEGVPVFYDSHHLSLEFAEMSGRMYAERNPGLFEGRAERLAAQPSAGIETEEDVPAFSLASGDGSLTSMPSVSAVQTDTGWRLQRAGPPVETTGGRTGVAHVEISGPLEARFAGRVILVEVSGIATAPTELRLQYSTNEVGNSGWHVFALEPGDFSVSFEYAVSPLRSGRGDFIGIDPVNAPVMITEVHVAPVRDTN